MSILELYGLGEGLELYGLGEGFPGARLSAYGDSVRRPDRPGAPRRWFLPAHTRVITMRLRQLVRIAAAVLTALAGASFTHTTDAHARPPFLHERAALQLPGQGSTTTPTQPLPPATDPGGTSNNDSDSVPWSAIATVASVVALSQFLFIWRQAQREQVLFHRDLNDSWTQLRPAWDRTILLARGPDDHYVNAAGIDKRAVAQGDAEVVRAHEVAAQDVIRFLGGLGLLVLDGKLKPSTVYAALGTEVVRNSRPLRILTESRPPPPAWP